MSWYVNGMLFISYWFSLRFELIYLKVTESKDCPQAAV